MLRQLWNPVFLPCINSNSRIKFIIGSSACLQQRVMDPLIPILFLRAHFILHSCFPLTVEEMPEQLTVSKTVYQQEEFSMKPKERQKCLSKTLTKKGKGKRTNSHISITITRKLCSKQILYQYTQKCQHLRSQNCVSFYHLNLVQEICTLKS